MRMRWPAALKQQIKAGKVNLTATMSAEFANRVLVEK